MKIRNLALQAAVATSFALAGCAGLGGGTLSPNIQTAENMIKQDCPLVQADMQALGALSFSDPTLGENFTKASAVVAAVCNVSTTVSTADIQSLVSTAAPAILAIINASTLPNKAQLQLDVTAISIVANGILGIAQQNGAKTVFVSKEAAMRAGFKFE